MHRRVGSYEDMMFDMEWDGTLQVVKPSLSDGQVKSMGGAASQVKSMGGAESQVISPPPSQAKGPALRHEKRTRRKGEREVMKSQVIASPDGDRVRSGPVTDQKKGGVMLGEFPWDTIITRAAGQATDHHHLEPQHNPQTAHDQHTPHRLHDE